MKTHAVTDNAVPIPAPEPLVAWLAAVLDAPIVAGHTRLIAGDASPRKYYRVELVGEPSTALARTLIAVESPASEKNPEFLHIRQILERAGVRVPRRVAADVEAGFLLLEDLGNDVLQPALGEHSVGAWYGMALNICADMAAIAPDTTDLPPYDRVRLRAELDLFVEWFAPQLLGLTLSEADKTRFATVSELLITSAQSQPQVFVHRDFHSRNLMVIHNRELAVIDFQDAVIGPITYDPVSLLKDCYVRWPRKRQLAWLADYRRLLIERGQLADTVSAGDFLRWFDLMGLQRHIKVLGIFARLWLRDGKPGYLKDLPRVLGYTREVLALYANHHPAIEDFSAWFNAVVIPACCEQPWYHASTESDFG